MVVPAEAAAGAEVGVATGLGPPMSLAGAAVLWYSAMATPPVFTVKMAPSVLFLSEGHASCPRPLPLVRFSGA